MTDQTEVGQVQSSPVEPTLVDIGGGLFLSAIGFVFRADIWGRHVGDRFESV